MTLGLDVAEAATMCQIEKYGDWYRDPWGWPELSWILRNPAKFPWDEVISQRGGISMRHDPRFEPTVVSKSRLGVRPAVVMSLDARIAYAAAVSQVSKDLHKNLPDWVYGWRLRGGNSLAKNRDEWKKYYAFFGDEENLESHALQTDITSFFASIDVGRTADIVYHNAGRCAGAQLIENILNSHDQLATRSGLPQRSWPSAILANRYMESLDGAVTQRIDRGKLTGAVRWMDDIYVTGEESALYRFFLDFQSRVREMGLEVNSAKSRMGVMRNIRHDVVFEGMSEVPLPIKKRVQLLQHESGVSEHTIEEADLDFLETLQRVVIQRAHRNPPAILKALLKTLRDHGIFDKASQWLQLSERLPHVAVSLGRYFRDAMKDDRELLEKYCAWYAEYRLTDWAAVQWSSAQFALAVPGVSASPSYKEVMLEWLQHSDDVHQISVAAQRLAVNDPTAAKDIIMSRIDNEARPFFQRIYGLALLCANADRAQVRRTLSQDPRNIVTLHYLEDTNYSVPKVPQDYDPRDGH